METAAATETIVAVGTAGGRAALGIVRVSGPRVPAILRAVTGRLPTPRHATLVDFCRDASDVIDRGIALYFPAPASYTGEDLCEFHGHGNPLLLHALVQAICRLGARPARPGEFTERAFLNDKLDLAQAESIADLIDSRSLRAARSALRTLHGEFSVRIDTLTATLVDLRVAFEGAIDFPDDISPDALGRDQLPRLDRLRADLLALLASATQGARLHDGVNIAIVGAPNVGKSTLLNRLARSERAIVSDIPGTTRDVLEVDVLLRDLPVHLFDTAGLRETADTIEQEGIRRATAAMTSADLVLLVTDEPALSSVEELFAALAPAEPPALPVLVVHNKIDRFALSPARSSNDGTDHVYVSARDNIGLDLLLDTIEDALDIHAADEGEFIARTRHVVAVQRTLDELSPIDPTLALQSPELVAEALRRAALALAEVVGGGDAESLLGEIFSRFCIGK